MGGIIMKKILFLSVFLLSLNTFAAYVYWDQKSETNTYWNFDLDIFKVNSYKDYGIYTLSEGLSSRSSLKEGDNALTVTENLGFWVMSNSNKIYDSYSNPGQRFKVGDNYTVNVFSNSSPFAVASITISPISPSGQPLPGILATILLGSGILGGSAIMKRNKKKAEN